MSRRRASWTALAGVGAFAAIVAGSGRVAAGPLGETVISGGVQITRSGAETTIRQTTPRADIGWDSFDVGAGERVTFQQPSSRAIALNRIRGTTPSAINGAISANGQVWLQNSAGILFGPSATVNVGGLLATTSRIPEADFAAGKMRFREAGGALVNQGSISTGEGGVAMVAPVIENEGVVSTEGGDVAMHAGSAFSVDLEGDGLLSLVVEAEQPLATALSNTGRISAEGGSVILSSAQAEAARDSVVSLGGRVEATGAAEIGGEIVITGAGYADVSGEIGAGRGDSGGEVTVDARRIGLRETARIDVSGPAGGGRVTLGPRSSPRPAERVAVARGARILADATGDGDGGRVDVWSTEATRFNGAVSAAARGSGDGGLVDISSVGRLGFDGDADLSSRDGQNGRLTFDPRSILVTSGSDAPDDEALIGDDQILFDDLPEEDLVISIAALEQASANIVLEATKLIQFGDSLGEGLQLNEYGLTLRTVEPDGVVSIISPISIVANDLVIESNQIEISAGVSIGTGAVTLTGFNSVATTAALLIGTGDATIAGDRITLGGRVEVSAGDIVIEGLVVTLQDGVATANGDMTIVGEDALDALPLVGGDDRIEVGVGDMTLSGGDILLGPTQVEDGNLTVVGDTVSINDLVRVGAGSVNVFGDAFVSTTVSNTDNGEIAVGEGSILITSNGIVSLSGPVGSTGGLVTLDAADAWVFADLTSDLGEIEISGSDSVFIDTSALVSGERVDITSSGRFEQADSGLSSPARIEGLGAGDGAAVEITAASVVITGSVFGEGGVLVEATGGTSDPFDGAVWIGPYPQNLTPTADISVQAGPGADVSSLDSSVRIDASGPVFVAGGVRDEGTLGDLDDIFITSGEDVMITAIDGIDGVTGLPRVITDNLSIDAANGLLTIGPEAEIELTRLDAVAEDFSIGGVIEASSARVGFSESGFVGGLSQVDGPQLDLVELSQFSVFDLTAFATENLTVGFIVGEFDSDFRTLQRGTLTAGGAITVVEDILGRLFDEAGEPVVPFSLSFGEENGLRPERVTVQGRIGGTGSAEAFLAAPLASLEFHVDGDVIFEPPAFDGGSVLLVDGELLIDVLGSFIQPNTTPTEGPLVDGEGGTGADVGFVTVSDAEALELFGVVGGLSGADAIAGVGFDGVEPSDAFQVNDCGAVSGCFGSGGEGGGLEVERDRDEFLAGVAQSDTLEGGAVAPDPDVRFGLFTDLSFIERAADEEEPISNRGNEEEWPR